MHSTPFLLDVGDLLAHPGEIRSVEFSGAIDAEIAQARVTGNLDVQARLEGLNEGIYMVARAEVPVEITCNRCLVDWEETLDVEVRQLFTRQPDEDGYGVAEHWIDTEGPIRDEVVLALPLVPVCREDCEGICASCGADLNTAPCTGHEEAERSPFAGLKDLLSD
jgi:uncharacterized protein